MIKRVATIFMVWLLLTAAIWMNGAVITRQLLPLYQWSLALMSDYYKIKTLRIERKKGQPVIRLKMVTAGKRQLGLYRIPAGIDLTSSTLMAHVLQPVIIFYTLLIAWPVYGWKGRAWLLLVSTPVLLAVLLLDVPTVLFGALEDLVYANFYPEGLHSSVAVRWMELMNGGGRLALPLTGALLSVLIWRRLDKQARLP